MKAAQFETYGDPTVITIRDINKPTLAPDQVLVRVQAASLNPFDTSIRTGAMKNAVPLTLPITLGGDIAGVIEALGEDVTEFSVGQRVYGQANVVGGNSGAFAEYAAARASQIAPSPANLTAEEAASLPLAGVSALQAITEHLVLKSEQKVFIHGGSGGIGSIAIQIARAIGACITTTASGSGIDLVSELGAHRVIDYKSEKFYEKLSEFDAVFDTVGGDDFAASLGILKRGGVAVSMIKTPDERLANELGVTAMVQSTQVTIEHLLALTKLITEGAVRPVIGATYPFEHIKEAFVARETGQVNGKIVLTIS